MWLSANESVLHGSVESPVPVLSVERVMPPLSGDVVDSDGFLLRSCCR